MKKIFEALIDSYLNDNVGVAEGFLSESLAQNLRNNLLALVAKNALLDAGTGNELSALKDKAIRSDKIYWLDKRNNDQYENDFFILMDDFIRYLNETCYTGITSYEFHYAFYEKGSFYVKHLDRFRNDGRRQFSMITYLNPNWLSSDGGELCIHHSNGILQHVSPNNRKSIFFKSNELEHEVLQTEAPRLSITGWLKK